MADSTNKGRIMTEIEGFGGAYYRSSSTPRRSESPFHSGTIACIPVRSKALPNLRILGIMPTFYQS